MKPTLAFLLVALLAVFSFAAKNDQPTKQVIVSYPKGTSESVLDAAKQAIEEAGGVIIHDYHLIVGFAAKAPAKVFESIQAMGASSNVLIEEDQSMSINNS